MTSLLSRAFTAIRVWIGLDDAPDGRPSHGWLLPSPDALERALRLVPIPPTPAPRSKFPRGRA